MKLLIKRGFIILNYITDNKACQAVIDELKLKKKMHMNLINDLCNSFEKTNKATAEKINRIKHCGDTIQLNEKGNITGANFCKNRYCPICQWRKSRRTFATMIQIQQEIEKTGKYQYLFLTLTLKNTENLENGINHILQSFKRLQDTKQYRRITKGFVRTLEITYNKQEKEWHPHLHIIIAVPEDYFINEDLYTDYEEWRSIWKTVAHVDYYPQCNIQKIDEKEREKAVAEISKYMIKPIDLTICEETESIYTNLLKSTFGRRLTSLGGIYRETHNLINKRYKDQCKDEMELEFDNSNVLYTYQYKDYNYIMTQVINKQ